jgi:hypothetical protein
MRAPRRIVLVLHPLAQTRKLFVRTIGTGPRCARGLARDGLIISKRQPCIHPPMPPAWLTNRCRPGPPTRRGITGAALFPSSSGPIVFADGCRRVACAPARDSIRCAGLYRTSGRFFLARGRQAGASAAIGSGSKREILASSIRASAIRLYNGYKPDTGPIVRS